jgi:hypothetical protein
MTMHQPQPPSPQIPSGTLLLMAPPRGLFQPMLSHSLVCMQHHAM